jgi:hypothetical protein
VIGQLNATSTIVQEVFIINNKEKPSGEHFVVTSLHDAPAESWKEKNLRLIEANYTTKSREFENKLEALKRQYEGQKTVLSEKITFAAKFIKDASPEDFKTMLNFLTGKITHLVVGSLYSPEIITMEEFEQKVLKQEDRWSSDGIKLITIYGKGRGQLNYRINEYSDGSGFNKLVLLFTNYADAHAKVEEILLAKESYDVNTIDVAKKYGIKLDAEKVKAYKAGKIKEIDSRILRTQEELSSWNDQKKAIRKI